MMRSLFSACARTTSLTSAGLARRPLFSPSSSGLNSKETNNNSLLGSNSLVTLPNSPPSCFFAKRNYCSSHHHAAAPSSMPLVEELVSAAEQEVIAVAEAASANSVEAIAEEIIHFQPMKYIEFTCSVCQERVAKTFSKHSYEKGVVIIKCSGCKNLHLIADNLGFTGYAERNVEDMAVARGETVCTHWEGELKLEVAKE